MHFVRLYWQRDGRLHLCPGACRFSLYRPMCECADSEQNKKLLLLIIAHLLRTKCSVS